MIHQFSKDNFQQRCNQLAKKDAHLQSILKQYGHPPMWSRPASFASLIHIILEQQVSLASAKAALEKLKEKIGTITPEKVLLLSDAELRSCYFSRQKTVYARCLAEAIVTKKLNLKKLGAGTDDEIRMELKKIKGIGDWTVDVYLLFVLQRADIFPTGDLAMMNALKEIKKLPKNTSKEEIIQLAEQWRPHRSLATMLLWHHYIKTRKIKL
ncbi:MAG: DNA-3-methyladenine glycosylase 2 family protein [Chitinophagaceae bacterium]